MMDRVLVSIRNRDIKDHLICKLAEKKLNSAYPEYYSQAIRIVGALEPARLVLALLLTKYTTAEAARILGISPKSATVYRKEVGAVIRKLADSDFLFGHSNPISYYLGLIDIDLWLDCMEGM